MAEESTPRPLFARPVIPVANPEDAATTAAAAFPHVAAAGGRPLVVNVVEKGGGAPDKAPLEQMQALAEDAFEIVRERADAAGIDVDTEVLYGTDVSDTILAAAREADATAVVFVPRGDDSFWTFLVEDVRDDLVTESDRPVVVLPADEVET